MAPAYRRASRSLTAGRTYSWVLRALPVWSERLGLSGKCDVVEAVGKSEVRPAATARQRGESPKSEKESEPPDVPPPQCCPPSAVLLRRTGYGGRVGCYEGLAPVESE